MRRIKLFFIIVIINLLSTLGEAKAQTFSCDGTMYLNQANILYEIGTSTNPFTYAPVATLPSSISVDGFNALGYNPVDNYMYGIIGSSNKVVQISKPGGVITFTDLGAPIGLPAASGATAYYNAGEFDSSGYYYVKVFTSNNIIYRIDLGTNIATPIVLSQSVHFADFTYNKVDGKFYGVDRVTGNLLAIVVNTLDLTGTVTDLGGGSGAIIFGGMMSSDSGKIYGVDNNGGFYQFNTTTGARTLISPSPTSTSNDATACMLSEPTFPVNLAITQNDGTTIYNPGTTITYTIVVSNIGLFGVTDALVTDAVPSGIPSANISYTAIASSGSTTSVVGTQTGAINDLVSLPVGGTVTYTVTLSIPSNFTSDLVNTANISTNSVAFVDTDTSNNTVTDIDVHYCTITTSNPDSDGDSVSNACDLDDDNDGILDINEYTICSTGVPIAWTSTTTGLLNNTFTAGSGTTTVTGTAITTASSTATGPQYFTGTNNIDVTTRGGTGNITGNQTVITFPVPVTMSEFNIRSIAAANGGALLAPNYDEVQIVEFYLGTQRIYFDGTLFGSGPGTIYHHPYYDNINATYASTGPYYDKITGIAYPSNTTTNTANAAYPGPNALEANYRFTINQLIDRIVIKQHANAKQDNIGFRVYGVCTGLQDTDGDGIYDHLDLDSDNDGCPDAAEGGNTTIAKTSLVASGGSLKGGNGVDPSITPTLGSYNQSVLLNLGNTVGNTSTTLGVPTIIGTGQGIGSSQNTLVNNCFCYESANITQPGTTTNHGITLLNRAGSDNDNWPIERSSGFTALESNTKGLVITRMTTTQITEITNPVEGMMVYDLDANCLKLYHDSQWSCFSTPACP